MRQINPMAKAWANAERGFHGQQLGWARKRKYMREGEAFLKGTHLYERTFSDKPTGETRMMNGDQAKLLNDGLFAKFLNEAELNVPGRSLERWKVVRKFVEEKEKGND